MTSDALVLLDYQFTICRGDVGKSSGLAASIEDRQVLERARTCLLAARSRGMNIAHVRVMFDVDYSNRLNRGERFARYERERLFLEGTPDVAFCDEVAPEPGELIVSKGSVDPFIGTPLLPWLIGRNVKNVFIGGVATHMVVESTARHACDVGLSVNVIEDICASHDSEIHQFSIEKTIPAFATMLSSEDFVRLESVGERSQQ